MKPLTIDELHQTQLDMLKTFDAFCASHNLRYFLAYGTLIGAIRHKGFIPWDDDVDVFMLREDFDKFVSFSAVNDRYKIVTSKNNQEFFHPFIHCNLADTKTVMDEFALERPTGKGVFIDVFPVDNLPNDEKTRKKHVAKCKRLIYELSFCLYPNASGGLKGFVKRFLKLFIRYDSVYKKLNCLALKYANQETVFVGNVVASSSPDKHIFRREYFSKQLDWDFEDCKLKIPVSYDAVLRLIYGDYMTPPPENKRTASHQVIYYWKDNQ